MVAAIPEKKHFQAAAIGRGCFRGGRRSEAAAGDNQKRGQQPAGEQGGGHARLYGWHAGPSCKIRPLRAFDRNLFWVVKLRGLRLAGGFIRLR